MISELGIVLSTNIPHRRNLEEERVVSEKVRYSRNQIHCLCSFGSLNTNMRFADGYFGLRVTKNLDVGIKTPLFNLKFSLR